MFKNFTDLHHIGVSKGKSWGKSEPANLKCEECRLPIMYNNQWGLLTDTHMDITADGNLIITGTFLRNMELFRKFLTATIWRGVTFKQSLNDFLSDYNHDFSLINNDLVYLCVKKESL